MTSKNTIMSMRALLEEMTLWAQDLGFQQLGISDLNLAEAESALREWLEQGFHGEMAYMGKHGTKRTRPEQLVPGTLRVITLRMDYWPESHTDPWQVLGDDQQGYISRYALGRDYHKLMRKRLAKLAEKITDAVGQMSYRVFCDSAPVMEKALAQKSGIGWQGKHSNIINRDHGSYFFLGEIYTDLPLPTTSPIKEHCGNCVACIDICPTQAIVAPYQVDARRCISYLTIELKGAIPEVFRPMIGNRIYGCDDCQLICPWNRFAKLSTESDYSPRHGLDAPQLIDLFAWDEATFSSRLAGSPIRRIGYHSWLRNIAVALGNATTHENVINALRSRLDYPSTLVREHVTWALKQHQYPI